LCVTPASHCIRYEDKCAKEFLSKWSKHYTSMPPQPYTIVYMNVGCNGTILFTVLLHLLPYSMDAVAGCDTTYVYHIFKVSTAVLKRIVSCD